MTTTSQSDGKDKPGSEPAKAEPSQEPKTVPLGEHIELRQKLRERDEKFAAMEAELAQLKNKPAPEAPKNPQLDEITKTLSEIQLRENRRAIQSELGLTDEKAADEVVKLMKEKGLAAREALTIASLRQPDLFASKERATGGEPQFASLTPRPGSTPQQKPDELEQRRAYRASLKGKDEAMRGRVIDNEIGGHLADALGWDHQLLKIPTQP